MMSGRRGDSPVSFLRRLCCSKSTVTLTLPQPVVQVQKMQQMKKQEKVQVPWWCQWLR